MPHNKDQHYVPQFYLRNFGEGDSIALFNLKRRVHVNCASIPGQCQRAYLYGKDGPVEPLLTEVERQAANTIRDIVGGASVLDDPAAFVKLIRFIVIQHGRTPQEAAKFNRMTTKMARAILGAPGVLTPELRAHVDDVGVAWNKPEVEGILIALKTGHLLLDLTATVLINDTETDFITSDCPVVLVNPWCRGWRSGGVTGWACAGLQVYLPLSPRYIVLLWNPEVYSMSGGPRQQLRITHPRDVHGLNALRLLSMERNLYYRPDETTKAAIDALPFHWHSDRAEAMRLQRAQSDEDGSELLHLYEEQPDVRLDLSFLNVRREMRHVPLPARARTYRPRAIDLKRQLEPEPHAHPQRARAWRVVETD
jgi:hypothetical protein